MTPEQRFWWTAREREQIRSRRAQGWPREEWTADPVFRSGRFCNVFRHHDKTSEVILRILRADPHPDRVEGLAVCLRLINRHETLRHWSWDRAGELGLYPYLQRMVWEGLNTNAYRLNTPRGLNSREGVIELMWEALAANQMGQLTRARQRMTSFREYCEEQGRRTSISSFIGYQAALDLRDLGLTCHMADDWAYLGPGAVRGAFAVEGAPVGPHRWEERGSSWVRSQGGESAARPDRTAGGRSLAWAVMDKLTVVGKSEWGPEWSIHETEGWLCEFDRYERIRMRLEAR